MIILQGAIHIFTEQPNSVAKSIYNGLRRQMTHLLEYETIKTSTIIQYPHAVSYFCELNLSYDYIAMTYSKKKGVPVLVSIVGKKVNQGLEVEEALRLYWGNRGMKPSVCSWRIPCVSAETSMYFTQRMRTRQPRRSTGTDLTFFCWIFCCRTRAAFTLCSICARTGTKSRRFL